MQHLIVFIRNPRLGKVKTRLAADIGDVRALEVYQRLLSITHGAVVGMDVPCRKSVWYSDCIPKEPDLWSASGFEQCLQTEGDLGARMQHAMEQAFRENGGPVVLIGSDCPEVSPRILQEAFRHLQDTDCVLGPAADGGYYLIGCRTSFPFVFQDMPWSRPELFETTCRVLKARGCRVHTLEVLTDIDKVSDLKAFGW
ncbi:MAG: TIGR04282 family arsenosugar biosynthesis glycosyltransferase [Flavobacteriales bacterium]|nr:TIGR04282 family arsenosugar biosynthesis glycosyltransferase [Flavobacteriales bacterium]MCB9449457.1 TIGR04282 family arsenosugar biosynthesis glycosyltransferase [Flavobacteriales bacterium]